MPVNDVSRYLTEHDLNENAINGLNKIDVSFVKNKIEESNNAMAEAGNSIYKAAKALSEIKSVVKNSSWIALTESGILIVNGRVARDLASAYESWLSDHKVPSNALAQVSARTLARIGKVEETQRVMAINMIKQGNGFTERDLSKLISNHSNINDKFNSINLEEINNISNEKKIIRFTELYVENIKLKKKIVFLKQKIKEMKSNRT